VANVSAVEELAKAGVQYIVYWSEEQPGSQLIAAHFGHAFCAALRNPVTTVPEVPWCLHHYDDMHAVSCAQLTPQRCFLQGRTHSVDAFCPLQWA